jgi:hypothetical protein
VGDLNRAEVDIFFLVLEGDATGGESDEAEDDEKYSNDGCGFHVVPFSMQAADLHVMPAELELDVPVSGYAETCIGIALGSSLPLHGKGGWSSL